MKSEVLVGAAASDIKSARGRKALVITTAMAAGLLASPMFFDEARASNECGTGSNVVCSDSEDAFPGSPPGNNNGGLEYDPSSAFTLTLESGFSVISQDQGTVSFFGTDYSLGFGHGVTVGVDSSNIFGTDVFSTDATNNAVTINTALGSSIASEGDGIHVHTDGAASHIEINAGGQITSGGAGIFAHTGDSGNPAGAGDITINHTGHIVTTGDSPGIVAWASNANAANVPDVIVNNTGNGTIEGGGDGIVIGNPTLSGVGTITASSGTGTVNNDAVIDVEGTGVFVNTSGLATVNNQENGSITSGGDGIYVGGMLLFQDSPLGTGSAIVTNDGEIDAGQNGIQVNVAGSATVTNSETGSILSDLDGIHVGGVAGGIDTPSLGSATVVNDGEIDAGRDGIFVFASTGGTITNDEDGVINAGDDGIQLGTEIAGIPTPSVGAYTITNHGEIGTAADGAVGGMGINAFSAGNLTVVNDGSILATTGGRRPA